MVKYKALKEYFSSTQNRVLKEGEVFEVKNAEEIAAIEHLISINEPGFLEVVEEVKKTRAPKVKEGE